MSELRPDCQVAPDVTLRADELRSALTREEWEVAEYRRARQPIRGGALFVTVGTSEANYINEERHALAALALYDQPFGFSWSDIDTLMESPPDESLLTELADRIAALLPPR